MRPRELLPLSVSFSDEFEMLLWRMMAVLAVLESSFRDATWVHSVDKIFRDNWMSPFLLTPLTN